MEMDVSSSNNSTIKQEFNEELGNENGEISTKSDVLQDLKFEIEYESHPSKTDHKDEIFVCDFCGEFLHSQKALGDHELQCKIKCESVPSKSGTKDKELHIKDEIFLCEVCQENFRSEEDLENHKLSHLAAEPEGDEDEAENAYVCSVCNDVFDSKKDLVEHKNSISECYEHRKCDKCGDGSAEEFSCIWELIDHVKDKHGLNVGDAKVERTIQLEDFDEVELIERLKLTGKYHQCEICQESFTSSKKRNKHRLKHPGVNPFPCGWCEESFTTRGKMRHHRNIHIGKPYSCNYCTKTFRNAYDKSLHERAHNSVKPFQCESCDKSFNFSSDFIRHKYVHTGEKNFSCGYCSKTFNRDSNRKIHEKTHSEVGPRERSWECEYCAKTFARKDILTRHKKVHDPTIAKPYSCKYCSKTFTRNSNMKMHEKRHTDAQIEYEIRKANLNKSEVKPGERSTVHHESKHTSEKIFTCDLCLVVFTTKSKLKSHRHTHTGKPYSCQYCSLKFPNGHDRTMHEKRVHSREKPFQCESCNISFNFASHLDRHKLIHTGEKIFSCEYCAKTFNRDSNRKIHEKTHDRDRPQVRLECEICLKTFARKDVLNRHKKGHNTAIAAPYSSKYCSKSFTRNTNRKMHEKKHL